MTKKHFSYKSDHYYISTPKFPMTLKIHNIIYIENLFIRQIIFYFINISSENFIKFKYFFHLSIFLVHFVWSFKSSLSKILMSIGLSSLPLSNSEHPIFDFSNRFFDNSFFRKFKIKLLS